MSGWPAVPLGSVVKILGGGTPSKDEDMFWNGTIPWASVRDLKDRWLTSTEFQISEQAIRASASRIVPAGNVIICTRVGLGKVVQAQFDVAINQDLKGLIPKDPAVLNPDFLYYWYQQIAGQVVAMGTGATVQGVKIANISGLPIPMPPLDEQKRIVARLDKLKRLSAEIAERHDKKRRLIETQADIFIEQEFSTLDCPQRPISDVTERVIDHRGKTPGKLGGEFTPQGVPVISAIHVKGGEIHWGRRARFVSVDMFKRWMKEPLRRGDVLLTSEAPLGEVAFVPNDDPLVLSQRLFALRGDPRSLDSEYLGYYLQSKGGQRQLQGRKTGATVSGIKQSELAKVLIPIPSLMKQREVAVRIKQVISLTRIMQRVEDERASMLSTLTSTLATAAFAGDS